MKIGVLGSGNMGCALAVLFSQNHDVTLFSNSKKASVLSERMQLYTEDTNRFLEGKIKEITNSLEAAICGSEYIFITFPAFMFEELSKKVIRLLSDNQHLVFIPGSGGAELFFKDALSKNCTITGLQRVHAVVRIVETGKLVKQSGIRQTLKVASIPYSFNDDACKSVAQLFSMKVEPIDNYLNITLVNSNPILHTARLYSIFKDYPSVSEYDSIPMFYKDWDIASSRVLISMDEELFALIDVLNKFGMEVNHITPILKHYDSWDEKSLTKKICSINSLRNISTPAIKKANGKYIPDLSSRYFASDFPFGLDIIIAFSNAFAIHISDLDKVSLWYHEIMRQINNDKKSFFTIGDSSSILRFYGK